MDSKWSLRVSCDLDDWQFGWDGLWSFLGIGVVALGPLLLTITWPVPELDS